MQLLQVRNVKEKGRLTAIDSGGELTGAVWQTTCPLAVLGKDPQKYDVHISILEVEYRLPCNPSTSNENLPL